MTECTPESVGRLLLEQAKLCQTPNGGGLLLALKSAICGGLPVYDGCDSLWKAADHLANQKVGENEMRQMLLSDEFVVFVDGRSRSRMRNMEKFAAAFSATPLPCTLSHAYAPDRP